MNEGQLVIIIKPRLMRHMSVTKEDESQASMKGVWSPFSAQIWLYQRQKRQGWRAIPTQ